MKLSGRNLSEWLRRAGLPVPAAPLEYAPTVQPVEVVGDASALTSQLVPPQAFSGVTLDPALNDIAFELHCKSDGGLLVFAMIQSQTTVTGPTNGGLSFGVFPAPVMTAAGFTDGTVLGSPGVRSTYRGCLRTNADQLSLQWFNFRTAANLTLLTPFTPPIFVPPAGVFYIENPQLPASGQISVGVSWLELLA